MSNPLRDHRQVTDGKIEPTRAGRVISSDFLDQFLTAYVDPRPIDAGSDRAWTRQRLGEWIERQIQHSVWRAERRGQKRRLPSHVRHGVRWVMAQRRVMAMEIIKAMRERGASRELAAAIAEQACQRFPRNGVVIVADVVDKADRPRARRAAKTNPRAQGTSPRQRAKRAAADLSLNAIAPTSTPAAAVRQDTIRTTSGSPRPSAEELDAGYAAVRASLQAGGAKPSPRARIEAARKAVPAAPER